MKLVIPKESPMLVCHVTGKLQHHTSKHDKHLDATDEIGHADSETELSFRFLDDKEILASALMIKGRFRMFKTHDVTYPYLFVVSQSIQEQPRHRPVVRKPAVRK